MRKFDLFLFLSIIKQLPQNVVSPASEEDHSQLIRFPTFALFKMWKPFYLWRTKVHSKKFHLARESLQNTLFLLSPVRVCIK